MGYYSGIKMMNFCHWWQPGWNGGDNGKWNKSKGERWFTYTWNSEKQNNGTDKIKPEQTLEI